MRTSHALIVLLIHLLACGGGEVKVARDSSRVVGIKKTFENMRYEGRRYEGRR